MIYVLYAIGALAVLVLLIVIVAASRPSRFRVSRSIQIGAAPLRLFPYINNLKKFQEWSPYKDKDPLARNEFEGPEEGPGAVFRWSGDGNVGAGSMTIVKTVPENRVSIDLEFLRPFRGRNSVEFTLLPQPNGTTVSWNLEGAHAFVPKIVGLFMNMDKMIGGDFEIGLGRLKKLAEEPSA